MSILFVFKWVENHLDRLINHKINYIIKDEKLNTADVSEESEMRLCKNFNYSFCNKNKIKY